MKVPVQARPLLLLLASLWAALVQTSCRCAPAPTAPVRAAAFAGQFYPSDPGELQKTLDQALTAPTTETGNKGPSLPPRAIIVPHGGYEYSARIAGPAYALFTNRSRMVKRVILLAFPHRLPLSGITVVDADYQTPIGNYPVDREAIAILRKAGVPTVGPGSPLLQEHSDEVQVPFLLRTLPEARLVPVLVGSNDSTQLEAAARALLSVIDDRTLLVVSSDFAGIRTIDDGAIQSILQLDGPSLEGHVRRTGATICGIRPIQLLLKIFSMRTSWRRGGSLLAYGTSSVSYAALALGELPSSALRPRLERAYLRPDEEKLILRLSRFVLNEVVANGQTRLTDDRLKSFPGADALTGSLATRLGAFVTLKKNGQLRGCIGTVIAEQPVYRNVIENTLRAALHDSRFSPVQPSELPEIDIEVSVMTPLERVGSLDEIQTGRDGLLLRHGAMSGLLLPQVPLEWNWTKTEFLENLSIKAGLSRAAYQEPGTELFRFSAQVFGERP